MSGNPVIFHTMNEKDRVDLLYQEFQRLNARLDQLSDASIADFKLLSFMGPLFLGVIGVLTKLDIATFFKGLEGVSPVQLFFLVFLGLWFTVAIIAFKDYIRLSLINYHVRLIWDAEKRLRALLGDETIFRSVEVWLQDHVKNHRRVYLSFIFVTVLPVLVIPVWVLLLFEGGLAYAVTYLVIALLCLVAHMAVGATSLKSTLYVLRRE